MAKAIYFQVDKFVDSVIKDMKLHDINAPTRLALHQMIEEKLAERIVLTIIDHFGAKEVEMFDKLLNDHPEMSEIDAMIMMAPDIQGLKEDLENRVNSLYKELTYDAARIDEALLAHK
ncbi:hypothetical protein KBB06_02120 [Candidatus Gracilibacteria bacterium]|nr:hypothetical protein [Candidatus Gracilibacteria bacterium]